MKGRTIIIGAVFLAVICVLVYTLVLGPPEKAMSLSKRVDKPTLDEAKQAANRRRLVPDKVPGQDDPGEVAKDDDEERPRPFAMKMEPEPALSGMTIGPSTEEERKKAGVTEQFGRGVTITKVHPDAPAAEVSLRNGDVIVRAETTNINNVEDLKKMVGDRDHTLITFARDGILMQVVLKKPFVPKKPLQPN